MLEQGPDFWFWFDKTQFSYHCVHVIHAKVFSIRVVARGGRYGNCPTIFPGKAKTKKTHLNDCYMKIKYIYASLLYSNMFYSPKS